MMTPEEKKALQLRNDENEKYNASISPFIRNMESVFTCDGRGGPKKCQLLLDMIKQNGIEMVLKEIETMANNPPRYNRWVYKGGLF
jgi:hypothetical protein